MSTAEEFKKHDIVADVIPKAPEKRAKVVFDSGVEVCRNIIQIGQKRKFIGAFLKANLGNTLTPTQVQNPPKVTWEAEAGKLYTLVSTGKILMRKEAQRSDD